MLDAQAVVEVAILGIVALFFRRAYAKLEQVYDAICGTPEKPGLREEVDNLNRVVFGRRKGERNHGAL